MPRKMSQIFRVSLNYALHRTVAHVPKNQTILKLAHPSYYRCASTFKYKNKNVTRSFDDRMQYLMEKLTDITRKFGRLPADAVRKVLDEVRTTGNISTSQSLMLIRCCGSLLVQEKTETRMKLVEEIWEALKTLDIERGIQHYNALLKVYIENEYSFSPSDFLADLEKKRLVPNRITYQWLIMRYCQCGDIDGATRILQQMREKDMPLSINMFNSLILGHSLANNMENAEGILNIIEKAGFEPTSETFTLLICGYIKQRNLKKADSLLHDYEYHGVVFTAKDYTNIVHAYITQGYSNKIDEILDRASEIYLFNQDASNLAVKLIMMGKLEEAFKVVNFMKKHHREDGTELPLGNFFIAHMIRCDVPPDIVVKYSLQLMKDNINPKALNVAIQNSLEMNKEKSALVSLEAAKENDVPVRYHYFWPLLVQRGKQKDVAGITNLLSTMYNDFDIAANSETLRDYVLPYMLEDNTDVGNLAMSLKSCGITVSSFIASVVINLLRENKIQKAAEIAESYSAHYPVYFIRLPLVTSFLVTKNVHAFVTLLREIAAGADWFAKNKTTMIDEDGISKARDYREYSNVILGDAVRALVQQNSTAMLDELFQQLLENRVGITVEGAKVICRRLEGKSTPEVTAMIHKLTSENFATPLYKVRSKKLSVSFLDLDSLERLYEIMKTKGEPTTQIKKQLFVTYAREVNLEKLLEIKKELDDEAFVFSSGMYAVLIDTFIECNKLDEAMNVYRALLKQDSTFNLNSKKLLRLALLLVQHGRYDEAFEVLQKKPNDSEETDVTKETDFINSALCRKILDVFAENGDVEKIEAFFELFLSNELVTVNNTLLGPLIKVHLNRDDLESAMKKFETCVLKYRATPWNTELCRALVQKEDAANLQRFTNLCTDIHGESNSIYTLILIFVECNRVGQARKLLQTSGLPLRADRLLIACQKYSNEGSYENLSNLLELTKELKSMDRSEIFYHALLVCNKANDHQKALSLWIQMQDEDVVPKNEFLTMLAGILKRNNEPVPFNVPAEHEITNPPIPREYTKHLIGSSSTKLRKLIHAGNINEALKLLKQLKPEQFNRTDWSLLMEACVTNNRYLDAKNLLYEYHSLTGEWPNFKQVKHFLGAAMKIPDIELFANLDDRLSNDLKKKLSFDNHSCRAYLNAGRSDQCLTKLEQSLDSAQSKEEFDAYIESFPRGGILSISELPEYSTRIENLISKCLKRDEKNIIVANILWIHYMLNGQLSAADKTWKTYLQNTNQPISFRKLTVSIMRDTNAELGLKFMNMMESKCNVTSPTLGIVYGTLISVYVKKNAVKEALKILERALSRVKLDDIMRSSLVTLKAAAIAQNISFPYEMPVNSIEV